MKQTHFFPENDTNHERTRAILQTLRRENMCKGWDKAAQYQEPQNILHSSGLL